MYGKSAREVVLWILFFVSFAFAAGLLFLCAWGMYSRSFIRFFNYAFFVSVIEAILFGLFLNELEDAERTREQEQIHNQRNVEHMMHFENETITNKSRESIIETTSEQELLILKTENSALKLAVSNLGSTIQVMNNEREAERKGCRAQYNELLGKYERNIDEVRLSQRLLNSFREKYKADEKEWRKRVEISHLEHMELRAWRKTEKARRKRDDKLRSRVLKIRERKKTAGLIAAANDFAVATKTEREYNIPDHRLEISNAIIALVEYLHPYNPDEELQAYLWDCRTAESLLDDIRSSIVRTAFGPDWENRILSGLVGLNVITVAALASLSIKAPKPRKKRPEKKKRPTQ